MEYDDIKSLTSANKGIRSRLIQDFRKRSKLDISFVRGEEEGLKIGDFNRYLENTRTIPPHIKLDFALSGVGDVGAVLFKLFVDFGQDLETLTLRLRDLLDFERLQYHWEFLDKLTELHLDFDAQTYDSEPTTRHNWEDYVKGFYLSSLRELSLPFESIEYRPVKIFLFQADLAKLVHLSSPDGTATLDTYMLKKIRRYTGIQFEPEGETGLIRYQKSANQHEAYSMDYRSSDEDSDLSDDTSIDDDEFLADSADSDLPDNASDEDENSTDSADEVNSKLSNEAPPVEDNGSQHSTND